MEHHFGFDKTTKRQKAISSFNRQYPKVLTKIISTPLFNKQDPYLLTPLSLCEPKIQLGSSFRNISRWFWYTVYRVVVVVVYRKTMVCCLQWRSYFFADNQVHTLQHVGLRYFCLPRWSYFANIPHSKETYNNYLRLDRFCSRYFYLSIVNTFPLLMVAGGWRKKWHHLWGS